MSEIRPTVGTLDEFVRFIADRRGNYDTVSSKSASHAG
jgi:hypothetical protein